ncbi:CLUMA_CG000148, isoform A [Clunio marinus]|uniref:CLUMA_CG000148, isoform A n=1 Tax=Clunio marinus TaxID=568069 RepID=A0A1J1HG70_9DIPT|nr:CLUMA_CG000148, isoform A [Clunio marinus]
MVVMDLEMATIMDSNIMAVKAILKVMNLKETIIIGDLLNIIMVECMK